jgi:hypothetical protein
MTAATTTFTAEELAGLEQFRGTLVGATDQQKRTTIEALKPGGSIERRKGAPRREMLDEMARIIAADLAPAVEATPVAAPAAPVPAPAPVSTDLAVGTRAVVVITETGRNFGKTVDFVKRLGGKFDAQAKVWVVRITENNAESARRVLVSAEGHFTGYQLIDNAAWIARRQDGGR